MKTGLMEGSNLTSSLNHDVNKKNIAFIIGKLSLGGAQRVISTLSNILIKKYNITIITTVKSKPFYSLDKRINLVACYDEDEVLLNSTNLLHSIKLNYNTSKRVTHIVKVEKIDVIIGFITKTNIYAVIAAKLNSIPSIISERTNPDNAKIPVFWKVLRKIVYPFTNYLVVQTLNVREFYIKWINPNKIILLPNPISTNLAIKKKECNRKNIVLTAGRLHWVKNQKMIIEAFTNINTNNWQLLILGEGEEREELEKLIKKKNVNNIQLLGSKSNIEDYYNEAKIFTFTSFYEGFPNALIEAMHFGLAPISTNCPSGPSELIENGVNGFLIEIGDVKALERQLEVIMNNHELRKKISENAMLSTKKYQAAEVTKQWDNLISKCFFNE